MTQNNTYYPHKLHDTGNVVRGGRVERFWLHEGVQIYPQQFIGVDEVENHPWLYDPEKAIERFSLRSIEFGNWMNQEERANFLYASMLSLHHLARILKIKDHQIGFGGRLSIALGARGKGKAAGHYEPSPYAVINLTKTQGIGVIAHEYAHAIDNILSFHTGGKQQMYVSGGRTTRKGFDENIAENGNYFEQQFEELFNRLFFDNQGNPTEFSENLQAFDDYWHRRNEIFARTFEVYISLKKKRHRITNHFLVRGTQNNAYPSADLVKEVMPIIENILHKGFEVMAKNRPLAGITVNGYQGFRKTIKHNASLDDTLQNMQRIAYRDTWQVAELAKSLQGDTVKETCENIWNFLRQNTRYKLDRQGVEELRTPARSLVDGKKGLTDPAYGIDCDDYTILTSALLLNLGIPHEYRVAAYEAPGQFQHIYVAAFDAFGNTYIIDPVPEIPHFNYEAKPIIDLKIITMELQELSGVNNQAKQELLEEIRQPFALSGIDNDPEDEILEQHFLFGLGEVDTEEEADIVLSGADLPEMVERGLLAEVMKAKLALMKEQNNPSELSQIIDVEKELSFFNDLTDAWDDADERMDVIQEAIESGSAYSNFFKSLLYSLTQLENEEQLSGLDDEEIYLARMDADEMADGELGLFRRRKNRSAKKGRLRNFFKKVGNAVKKGIKAVVKYNPATIAMRTAVLLLLKVNFLKIAEKLIYGYLTEEQAKAQNLDLAEWQKIVNAKNKLESYYTKIGGDATKFKAAIVKGRAAKKTGLQLNGLGAASVAAASASASPFIVFAKKLLSSINPVKLFKNIKQKIAQKQNKAGTSSDTLPADTGDDLFTQADNAAPAMRMAEDGSIAIDQNDKTMENDTNKSSFMQKVKNLWTKYKKPLIITGVGGVTALIAFIFWRKMKAKKKRSLAGIKAARTRARNRKTLAAASRKSTRTLKGSTTILKVPTKSIKKARVSKRSNAARLKLMHQKAKQLQKKHPNTKYSTLLKRAAKMI